MGPDQVRVNVAFGGICGSDLHIINTVVLARCASNNRWHSGMKFQASSARWVRTSNTSQWVSELPSRLRAHAVLAASAKWVNKIIV